MIFTKAIYHINAFVKLLLFKIIYGHRLVIGFRTTWRKNFVVNVAKTGKVVIGNNCFFNNNCSITSLNLVVIDNNSIFGEGVKIYDHNHKFYKKNKLLKEQGYSVGTVKVGKNCWIGSNVVLLKGTEIGDNCVIGAGCIIDGKINAGTIVRNSQNYIIRDIHFR